MIKCTILKNGDLKITAGNTARQWIKDHMYCADRNNYDLMEQMFEGYSCNSSFTFFNPDNANPSVGLTSAPCIAESMTSDDDGKNNIVGRLWHFPQYALRYDLEELKNKGFVVYTLAE